MGIYVTSNFWLLWIEQQWTWMSKCPCGENQNLCSRAVAKMDFVVGLFPAFWETATLASIVVAPVCTHSSRGHISPFLIGTPHLVNTCLGMVILLVPCFVFYLSHSDWEEMKSQSSFILHFPEDDKHVLKYSSAICISSLESPLFRPMPHF